MQAPHSLPTRRVASAKSATALSAKAGPSVRKKYRGTIVFVHSHLGEKVVVRATFPQLPEHSAFDNNVQDFISEHAGSPGVVYKFDGTYMLFKNGHPSFAGHVTEVAL